MPKFDATFDYIRKHVTMSLDTNYEMLINQTYKKLKQHVRYDIICRIIK